MRRTLEDDLVDAILSNAGTNEGSCPDACCAFLLAHPWPAWAKEIGPLSPEDALVRLGSGWAGLAPGHAEEHLRSLGPNVPKEAGRRSERGWRSEAPDRVFVIRGRGVEGQGSRWIPAALLAAGDLILLSAGDPVPADVRILRAHEFIVGEEAVTGRTVPVRKAGECPAPAPEDPVAFPDLAFQGSRVVSGTATALVVATGRHTLHALLRAS
jgi:cation transport ATPase